jgi:hypothetical protein
MVTPELKQLLSPDLERGSLPVEPSNCCVALQALIGPRGENASESFQFVVVTPSFLAEQPLPRWGRGTLVVSAFNWTTVDRMLERLIAAAARKTWQEVAAALSQDLNWEFDNYSPHVA